MHLLVVGTYPRTLPMMRRRAAALTAVLVLGLAGCGSEEDAPTAPAKPATGLSSESGGLVGGGTDAFLAQVRKLKGTPIVVNQWASWCGPCRFEFPFFKEMAEKYEGRVAFLGVDSNDSRSDAEEFLRENPVPYPSYFDPDVKIAREFKGGIAWPTTAFFDRSGMVVATHAGAYANAGKLEEDIRQYALGG
jgi:cytochrome c biogenesis protein CcmG/thiol:disulfide interchange protein DsbE